MRAAPHMLTGGDGWQCPQMCPGTLSTTRRRGASASRRPLVGARSKACAARPLQRTRRRRRRRPPARARRRWPRACAPSASPQRRRSPRACAARAALRRRCPRPAGRQTLPAPACRNSWPLACRLAPRAPRLRGPPAGAPRGNPARATRRRPRHLCRSRPRRPRARAARARWAAPAREPATARRARRRPGTCSIIAGTR